MKRHALLVSLVLASGSLVGACGTPQAGTAAATSQPERSATMSSTAEVLARHQKTFGASDLEGILADYASDAVMFTPTGPIKGTEALRKAFQTMFAEWGKPGLKFEMKQQTVEGPYAYMFWSAETADNKYDGGTDAFVVNNGKIVAHFFAAKITPKH